MTNVDTSALRTVMEEATPGPWAYRDGIESAIEADGNSVLAGVWCNDETADLYVSDADAAYIVALVNAAPDLLDELDQLREARALAWESGLNSGIGWALVMGKPGFNEPTNPFLVIPAESTGVSRESIEQIRWAEANPDAVALDDVEAKRRSFAESSSQQKRVREMGESDWSNVAPFDTESETQQTRRTAGDRE